MMSRDEAIDYLIYDVHDLSRDDCRIVSTLFSLERRNSAVIDYDGEVNIKSQDYAYNYLFNRGMPLNTRPSTKYEKYIRDKIIMFERKIKIASNIFGISCVARHIPNIFMWPIIDLFCLPKLELYSRRTWNMAEKIMVGANARCQDLIVECFANLLYLLALERTYDRIISDKLLQRIMRLYADDLWVFDFDVGKHNGCVVYYASELW